MADLVPIQYYVTDEDVTEVVMNRPLLDVKENLDRLNTELQAPINGADRTMIMKFSEQSGFVPLAENLEVGELFLNVPDKTIYSKNADDIVFEFLSSGGGIANYSETAVTAGQGQTNFTFSYTVGQVQAFINGVKIPANEFAATDGITIIFDQPLEDGDLVEFVAF